MASEACCNKDQTQAVFPDLVIPLTVQVKGCSKRNRWHYFEDIATVWNGVRQALLCLIITCLCMLSFLLNDFSQTEQNQLMPASQEQSVDREKGRMLRIYIGLLLVLPSFTTTTFLLFSFSITPITFLLFSFSTITTFLYFLPPPRITTTFLFVSSSTTSTKFLFFPFKSFYKRP